MSLAWKWISSIYSVADLDCVSDCFLLLLRVLDSFYKVNWMAEFMCLRDYVYCRELFCEIFAIVYLFFFVFQKHKRSLSYACWKLRNFECVLVDSRLSQERLMEVEWWLPYVSRVFAFLSFFIE